MFTLSGLRRPGPMVLIALVYSVAVSAIMIAKGISVSPDYILLLMTPLAILAGKFIRFLKDWVPFIALFLGWEAMRGIAPDLGVPPHVADMANFEKALFFGNIPTVALQNWAGQGALKAVGLLCTIIYFCHFIFPLALGMVMWLVNRTQFLRYTTALLGMSCLAFIIYLLAPTAAPWYAQDQRLICCFQHVLHNTLPSAVSPYYEELNPNQFAAFPSLHAAFPFLTFLAIRKLYPRGAWLAFAWCCAVWFSIVFLGEHYVIDVIGGAVFAGASWAIMMRLVVPRMAMFREPIVEVLAPEIAEREAIVA